ncbi:DUF748 domain-containing protein [Shewanella maritima]|uniref:DUF748 domain-containing protein n=1 Tax=Shewanella maritima TaxID=2520507 RepID=UPI0037356972
MKQFLVNLSANFFNRPRYQRWLSYFAVTYLVFVSTVGLILPYIVTQQLPKQLSQMLNRDVSIASVSVNPFTFEITANQFSIAQGQLYNSNQALFEFNRLYVDIGFWRSLSSFSVVVNEVYLNQPAIKVAQLSSTTQFSFSFDDIIKHLANQAETSTEAYASDENTSIFPLTVQKLNINDGQLEIEDKHSATHLRYPQINLSVSEFNTRAAIKPQDKPSSNTQTLSALNAFSFQLQDAANSQLVLDGQLQLAPFILDTKLELTQFDLSYYFALVEQYVDVQLTSAKANLTSNILLKESSLLAQETKLAEQPSVEKTIEHSSATVSKPDKQIYAYITNTDFSINQMDWQAQSQPKSVITIDSFGLDNLNLNNETQNIEIERFYVNNSQVNTQIDDSGVSLVKLFTPKWPNSNDPVTRSSAKAEVKTNAKKNSEEKTKDGSKPDSSPWLISLAAVELSNQNMSITESVATQNPIIWDIENINVTTGEIHSDLAAAIDYQLSAQINQQGTLNVTGNIEPSSLAGQVNFELASFALPDLQRYIAPHINITLSDGAFSTKGLVTLLPATNQDQTDNVKVTGDLQIEQLNIDDNLLKTRLVNWQNMTINQFDFDRHANQLLIDQVNFEALFGRFVIAEDGTTNVNHLFEDPAQQATEAKASEPKTTESEETENNATQHQNSNSEVVASATSTSNVQGESKPVALSINDININNSSAFFADNSLTPNFASAIEMLNGKISNLTTQTDSKAKVDLEGKIDKYAPMSLKGEVNPLLEKPYVDLNLNFDRVELTSANPYSGTYAGYYIDKGQLSINLKYQIEDNQLQGSNHVVINQLELGKPSNSSLATSLPVTLAIALLQDRHGVIDLGVDVEGDMDSPSFSFGGVILQAMTNVITKAVTAPFSLLAGLIDGDEDDLSQVQFAAGQVTLDEDQQQNLTSLAGVLVDRPLLMLSLKGAVDSVNDSQALKRQKLANQLAQQAQIKDNNVVLPMAASQIPESGPIVDALEALFNQQISDNSQDEIQQAIQTEIPDIDAKQLAERTRITMYNLLLKATDVTESELGSLAQQRADAVKAYLVDTNQVDPSRVFIVESRINYATDAAMVNITLDAN